MANNLAGLLDGYRVLDLTGELGWLAGKILGDLGADVIKIEPPGGDPGRRIGPFYHDRPDPEKSLYWWAYNTNKRSITLDITTESGRQILRKLVRKADFVLESFPPGFMAGQGLSYQDLRCENPGIIYVSVTPFGQTGPYSGYRASDIEIMAASGLMSVLGSPDHPPVRTALPQSYMWAGMSAAMGALVAHNHRGETGEGQYVDVSAQASTLWAMAPAPAFWDVLRQNVVRDGAYVTGRSVTGAKMRAIYPCRDGYINFIVYGGAAGKATNKAMVQWMHENNMATDYLLQKDWDSFDIATVTQEEIDAIEGPVAEFLLTRTKQEFFEEAIKRRMLGYPVASAEDIMRDPQLRARNFWQKVHHRELGENVTYPGPFGKFSEGYCGIRLRPPLIGEHNAEIYRDDLGFSNEEILMLREGGVI
ncbi:MAG: CaiB/BaiF CoA transferase family protein [Bacillota bacterium]